jgi:hypothetical protein
MAQLRQEQSAFVSPAQDQSGQYPAPALIPLGELVGRPGKVPPVKLHPQCRTLQIPETNVEAEGDQSVKVCLAISSARAQSNNTALKPSKIAPKNRINAAVAPDFVMLRP